MLPNTMTSAIDGERRGDAARTTRGRCAACSRDLVGEHRLAGGLGGERRVVDGEDLRQLAGPLEARALLAGHRRHDERLARVTAAELLDLAVGPVRADRDDAVARLQVLRDRGGRLGDGRIVDVAVLRGDDEHEVRERRLGERALHLGLGAGRLGARVLEPTAAQPVVDATADDRGDRHRDQREHEHPPPASDDENRELAHPASRALPLTRSAADTVECGSADWDRGSWQESGMGSKRDLADALESVGLFSRCTARERRTIARHVQTASFPPDTDLVIEGEPGDALFVILSGTAAVLRDGVEVAEVGEGSYFGELAILDGAPRSATIRTKTRREGRRARDPDVPHAAARGPGSRRAAARGPGRRAAHGAGQGLGTRTGLTSPHGVRARVRDADVPAVSLRYPWPPPKVRTLHGIGQLCHRRTFCRAARAVLGRRRTMTDGRHRIRRQTMAKSEESRIRALITGTGRYRARRRVDLRHGRGARQRAQRRLAHPEGRHPARDRRRRAALRARRGLRPPTSPRGRRSAPWPTAGIEPVDIDLLIFASASHDVAEPATANMRAGRARLRARRGDGREERVQQLPQRSRRRAGLHRDRPGDHGCWSRPASGSRRRSSGTSAAPTTCRIRLAALTLGDAGAACVVEASADPERGSAAAARSSRTAVTGSSRRCSVAARATAPRRSGCSSSAGARSCSNSP